MKIEYDEISPITKNKCVLLEYNDDGTWEKVCMESGYRTTDYMHLKYPEYLKAFQVGAPSIITETRVVESSGQVWYKLFLIQGNTALIPDQYDGDNVWYVGKYRDKFEDESTELNGHARYVNNIARGGIEEIFDKGSAKIFEEERFIDAYDHFYKIVYEQD